MYGVYLNPVNSGFTRIIRKNYIDKTELIRAINQTIDTTENLICISRPRRFGKSFAAQMLCAYYDKTCDSHELFSDYPISENGNYEKYLNQYDVIYLDMTNLLGKVNPKDLVKYITTNVTEEILTAIRKYWKGIRLMRR